MPNNNIQFFLDKLKQAFINETVVKLIISKKRYKSTEVKSISVKPILIQEERVLNFVIRNNTNDITKNYDLEKALIKVKHALETLFFKADLFTSNGDYYYMSNKKGTVKVISKNASFSDASTQKHDHQKVKRISAKDNIYLFELGVTSKEGYVLKDKTDKFRQINKYIEILDSVFQKKNFDSKISIVDMGSGKGYLTFALYDYLKRNKTIDANVIGVEFRPNLVKICNDLASKCGFADLSFIEGTIENASPANMDVLIALHACDTATDEAIYRGIKADSELIICAPCCHKQIRKAFNVSPVIKNIIKHGILEERTASIVTDSLRALIMEKHGYKSRVFEFISSEHTAKNLMIIGEKRSSNIDIELIQKEIDQLKSLYGVEEHYLERLLNQDSPV